MRLFLTSLLERDGENACLIWMEEGLLARQFQLSIHTRIALRFSLGLSEISIIYQSKYAALLHGPDVSKEGNRPAWGLIYICLDDLILIFR